MSCCLYGKITYLLGGNGIILNTEVKESPYYFLAILNSSIASFFISKISIYLSGGFYASNKQFASLIPVKPIDFSNIKEVEKHDKIVETVKDLISLKQSEKTLISEKDTQARKVDALGSLINRMIYELYDVVLPEEIKLVENSVDLTNIE